MASVCFDHCHPSCKDWARAERRDQTRPDFSKAQELCRTIDEQNQMVRVE